MAFTQVTVTGSWTFPGRAIPITGTVTFTPTEPMANTGTVVSAPTVATLNGNTISVSLAATDDVDTAPATVLYQVVEQIPAQGYRNPYFIAVPRGGGSIDLATVPRLDRPNALSTSVLLTRSEFTAAGGGMVPALVPGTSLWSHGGAETTTRLGLGDTATGTGVLWLSYVDAPSTVTITKLMFSTGNTAAVTVTLLRLGLFTVAADDSVTLVARTAASTTAGTATYTDYSLALATTGGYPASYQLVAGHRYAFGLLEVATTTSSVRSLDSGVNSSAPPILARKITAQSDIAATYAVGALSTAFTVNYLAGLV
jgi:hypothetical protein